MSAIGHFPRVEVDAPRHDDPLSAATGSPRSAASGLWQGMRPSHWSKNVLVFVAPAAAGVLDHRVQALRTLAAFVAFSLAASGTYLINDTFDVEQDRHHPEKRSRPVANGSVSLPLAISSGFALFGVALTTAWLTTSWHLVVVIAVYAAVSTTYTLRLKREPVVELAAVASGFLLRAVAGGAATHVPLSNWFLVVTSFGALFIVTGKRSAEYVALGERRAEHRPVLSEYTPTFLRSTLTMTASVTVTAYCLWAFERTGLQARAGHDVVWIQLTVIPVILGVLHVLRLLDAGRGGAPEELVLRDRFLQTLCIVWLALFSVGLYG